MNTLEWLARLIAFDTTSCNSNKEMIDCIQAWFAQYHIPTRLTSHPKESKLNLFASLPAQNGSVEGGIIFSGHTDIVPVAGQQWDTPPFEAVQKADKIYGRGTCDMKGFIAVALALVPELQRSSLTQPIHFAFSYDEEVGCAGVPLLIADLQQANIKPKACIVGEPTEMRPIVAHKGIQVFRCHVRGQAAHSSLTVQGCNAIEYAAKLICFIRQLADEYKQIGPFDPHFDVPFTSVSTNMIQGGNATNIIPADCEFTFEFRHLPEMKPNIIIDKINAYAQHVLSPQMQHEQSSTSIKIDRIAVAPSFESAEDAEINKLVRTISGETEIRKVAYATEAGLFQQAHIPTIVCGPGNIEQAHRANEFVTIEQLKKCETFLLKVAKS
jgi:acetylornithine deacetylase